MTIQPQISAIVRHLPQQPGVYQFYNAEKKLLYIGKATNLRSRVQSYFRNSTNLSEAKVYMVAQIADIQYTVVDNPAEALLLETTLIKRHKPPYNVVMKDDKNFQYIHITNDTYPRIETTRQLDRTHGGNYFGPYTSGRAVRHTLRLLKTIFHFCESPPVLKKGEIVFPKRPCLDYHLGRCIGPCANAITAEEYQQMMQHIAHFLAGEYEEIQQMVEREMQNHAKHQRFEKAARLRDQLHAIESLMEEQKVISTKGENADYCSLVRSGNTAAVNVFTVRKGKLIHQDVFFLQHTKQQSDEEIMAAFRDQYYSQTVNKSPKVYTTIETRRGRNRKLLEMGCENAQQALQRLAASQEKRDRSAQVGLEELAQALDMKPEELHRIEIYDISNFQGKYSVGSMVVFIDGKPEPAQYRKFKIKHVVGPNDFASHQEVMDRRLQHLPGRSRGKDKQQAWPEPSLLIIDGGKGQLSAAKAILDALKLHIPIISLAKREEEIFVPGQQQSILLPNGSAGYHLIQRMRDEAHRFAIGFYRSRHLKDLTSTR